MWYSTVKWVTQVGHITAFLGNQERFFKSVYLKSLWKTSVYPKM